MPFITKDRWPLVLWLVSIVLGLAAVVAVMRHVGMRHLERNAEVTAEHHAHVLAATVPGLPDLLCVRKGVVHLLEVKDGEGAMLSVAQLHMHQVLRRAGLAVPIVTTPEEALEALEAGAPPRTYEAMRVGRPHPRRRYPPTPEDEA